jgi:parallel beta-helix repeat protein
MKLRDDDKSIGRRTKSVVIVSILVASALFVIFPMSLPTAEATKYHYMGSAALEDQDRGDGFDYNGDTVGDMKITWHAGADSPHIVNGDFLVEDGYILEIEADVEVRIDPGFTIQVGEVNGARLYCNGTSSSSQVQITENVTGSSWGNIKIVSSSIGYLDYTEVTDGIELYVNGSNFFINNSLVRMMDQCGIRAISSTISVTNSQIDYSNRTAIYCDSTDAMIDNSSIYGESGSSSILFDRGGDGIYLTGISSSITLSNSTVWGGRGGDGGQGGYAIQASDYDSRLRIIDNNLIQGGEGGDGQIVLDGGTGEDAIKISPVPNYNSPPAIEINNNTAIKGGHGGMNVFMTPGFAGDGGNAIWISDNDIKGGEIVIRDNDAIRGGDGEDSDFQAGDGGNGGKGLDIQGCEIPGSVIISQNSNIRGGNGGSGALGMSGDGGYGAQISNSNNVTIDQTTILGGDGGDESQGGAGLSGKGVYLSGPSTPPFTNVTIISSTLTGGNGGNSAGISPGNDGGSALHSFISTGRIISSTLIGGIGGDNSGPDAKAGVGGEGLYTDNNAHDMIVEDCVIIGGKGGRNLHSSNEGGRGGYAISLNDYSEKISLNANTLIRGGDGGDSIRDTGAGAAAVSTIFASQISNLTISNNIITTGIGGLNITGESYGSNISICINGSQLDGTNIISGNYINSSDRTASTYGIFLDSSVAEISDNDIYNNWRGILVLDSDDVTIGDGNRIFDNYLGILLKDSNGTIGMNNNISNNDFGIYCNNSNPMIVGDQIIDSNVVAVICDGGSSPTISNCTISSIQGANDFLVAGDSHPRSINTTFNKTATTLVDTASNLTVNWYLHVRVVDGSLMPEENADLWINDTHDDNLHFHQTPPDGWIKWIVVTEYVENQTGGKFIYTPHNVSAAKDYRFGIEIEDMDESKEIIIVLKSKFSIPMKKGWNMISVLLNNTDTTLANVLSDIDGNYQAVQWFNISDSKDPWKHYHINKGSLNDLTNIDNTLGLWIYMNSDDTLTVLGFDPDPVINIELKSGWNFVGYPNLAARSTGINPPDAFFSIGGFVDMVMHYDANDPLDQWKAWDPGAQSPDDLVMIEPGMGIWIHVTGDCTWVINW